MQQYHELCKMILEHGVEKEDRTGTGVISYFGYQMRFDLSKDFPLMTTKDMGGIRWKGIVYELLWFLSGDTNIKYLIDNGVNIWNPDAYRFYKETTQRDDLNMEEFVDMVRGSPNIIWQGDLGPIYGAQWRSWEGYDSESTDQIAEVIGEIRNNPDSRRLIVSSWNVNDIPNMALPPCHVLFQFYVANGKLSCQLYQRSGDVFLGIPYNIASYALLTRMIAQQCGLETDEFIHTIGDAHIYKNHIEQVNLQLAREPKPLPKLVIKRVPQSIDDYKFEDFEIIDYNPYPSIKGKVSF